MGLGASALITNAKKEPQAPPAPPFDPTSADNGLSVDAASGRIVLGNLLGDAAAPARLLDDREIAMEDSGGTSHGIYLNSVIAGVISFLSGYSIDIFGNNGSTPSITVGGLDNVNAEIAVRTGNASSADVVIESVTGQSSLGMFCGADLAQWLLDGSGTITFAISDFGIPITVMSFVTATQQMQLGGTQVNPNGADVQLSGTSTRRYLVNGKGAGAYNVDRDLDSDKLFINSAAATFNLPNMAAANNRPGFIFRVAVKNAAGVTVQAAGGQTIRFDGVTSSVGGTAFNTTVGSVVTLMWDGSDWVAECFTGAWGFT